MIYLQRVAQSGELVDLAVPITNIQELGGHKEDPNKCWLKYWVDGKTQSQIISGTVKHVTESINMIKKMQNIGK